MFSQIHIRAPLLTTTQPTFKSAKPKHIQQLFPFKMPSVIRTWGVVCVEEMRFPNQNAELEAKFEKHWAFRSILHQHLQRAPFYWKTGHLSKRLTSNFGQGDLPALGMLKPWARTLYLPFCIHTSRHTRFQKSLHLCICIKSLHYLTENPKHIHATVAYWPTMNF